MGKLSMENRILHRILFFCVSSGYEIGILARNGLKQEFERATL